MTLASYESLVATLRLAFGSARILNLQEVLA